MAKGKFTTRTLRPVGERELIRGELVYSQFENQHVAVAYDWDEEDDTLTVAVVLPGEEPSVWESIAAWPSIETAQIAAGCGYRKVMNAPLPEEAEDEELVEA